MYALDGKAVNYLLDVISEESLKELAGFKFHSFINLKLGEEYKQK